MNVHVDAGVENFIRSRERLPLPCIRGIEVGEDRQALLVRDVGDHLHLRRRQPIANLDRILTDLSGFGDLPLRGGDVSDHRVAGVSGQCRVEVVDELRSQRGVESVPRVENV